MSLKIRLLIAIIFLFTCQSFSQSFMHSIGGTPTLLVSKENPETGSEKFSIFQTVITYFPRLNFISNENSSVSIGAPVGVGFGVVKDLGGNADGFSFAYDLPVVVDYNFGFKSTPEAEGNFGGYLGAGFGYFKVNVSNSSFGNFSGATHGPILRGGIRFGSSSEAWGGHGLTIGLNYKKGIEKSKLSTYGIAVLYDF